MGARWVIRFVDGNEAEVEGACMPQRRVVALDVKPGRVICDPNVIVRKTGRALIAGKRVSEEDGVVTFYVYPPLDSQLPELEAVEVSSSYELLIDDPV